MAHLLLPRANISPDREIYVKKIPQRQAMSRLSAAALPLDLHIGEKRHQRMGAHRNDCACVEFDQRVALLRRQAESIGVAGGVGKKGGAARLVMGEAVQSDGQFDEYRLDRGIVRLGLRAWRAEPAERSVVMVPARLQRDDVGLALTNGAG